MIIINIKINNINHDNKYYIIIMTMDWILKSIRIIWNYNSNTATATCLTSTFRISLMLIIFCISVSANTEMNLAAEVSGYTYYGDVVPVKYFVQSGLSHINFTIRISRNKQECPYYTSTILIQHAGLPLVYQTENTFPSNFITTDPTFILEMNPDVQISFTVVRPLPGNWFIIAYDDYISNEIKQKGIDSKNCYYSIMSRVSLGDLVNATHIDYGTVQTHTIGSSGKMFSFKLPQSTYGFDIVITKCVPQACNVTVSYLPSLQNSIQLEYCQDVKNCSMHVQSPNVDDIQLIEIQYIGLKGSQQVTFSVVVHGCVHWKSSTVSQCKTLSLLDRMHVPETYNIYFGYISSNTFAFNKLNLTMAPLVVVPFLIEDPLDIGGTLKFRLQIVKYIYGLSTYMHLCGGLIFNHLPSFNGSFDLCTSLPFVINRTVTGVNFSQIVQYVPYPRAGTWHVVLQTQCFEQGTDKSVVCPPNVTAEISLEIQPCLDNGCSSKGQCKLIGQGSHRIVLTACKCDADYQGYACTDPIKAQSVLIQLVAALLLTLSNLFFLPAIIIALKRRFILEACVYTYTMFFSTFYHACDGDRLALYRLCIASYEVLQASDFFGSYCSIWYTLIAMAQIRFLRLAHVLQTIGAFFIFVGVVYDRRSVCMIIVPLLCGIVLIGVSWGIKMYKRKKLYPSWKRYAFFLLPGCVLAATGGSVFIFLETTENYKYLHSFWHVCVALCICFLLPPHPPKKVDQNLLTTPLPLMFLNCLSACPQMIALRQLIALT
ncbi:post-GPI attachment to proteins factor 6-like isoform X2 [Biomphalaria glabrata]|uniref:Post-GPI attachment to proteins factor 6-like isoform X2 n=1 Tax=Biomphalaria glabrata TaxID=6526 RepID=A0A9U8ECB9_BIOGL|nr:post-GPI attachment to proteins factor 6-like isoform X2 [Biomphalaria glabrata]